MEWGFYLFFRTVTWVFFTSGYKLKIMLKISYRKLNQIQTPTNSRQKSLANAFQELSSHLTLSPTCTLCRDAAVRWRSIPCGLFRLSRLVFILQLNKNFNFNANIKAIRGKPETGTAFLESYMAVGFKSVKMCSSF